MANTKTITKKKTDTDEVKEETYVAKKAEPVKEKRKFEATDVIKCRSVTYGELLLPSSKNKDLLYSWADYGDEQEVEYQDLRALRSRRSQYIYGPLFIIEDEDLLDEWKDLNDVYKKMPNINLDELFSLSVSELSRRLQLIPKAFKETIKNAASARILSGELDSISKIKAIDEVLGTDLCFYIH